MADRIYTKFFRARSGATAVLFAVALPMLVAAVGAAVEYGNLARRRTVLQVAADAASLAGANEMALANATDARVTNVATRIAQTKISDGKASEGDRITVSIAGDHSTVQVIINEDVESVFGKLLTLPSSELQVNSTAKLSGKMRLCMVGLDQNLRGTIHLDKNARVTANGCAIYSNSRSRWGLEGDHGAIATASLICSAGGVSGRKAQFTPMPQVDCPVKNDPLAAQPAPPVSGCSFNNVTVSGGSTTLFPGTYCGGLQITGKADVRLLSGIYIIKDGPLIVEGGASMTGMNVGFYFTGNAAGLRFDPDTSISLTAPKDGIMSGLLMFGDRNVTASIPVADGKKPLWNFVFSRFTGGPPMREYRIISDDARVLLGTIYLPDGHLIIDSNKPVADKSAYTVILARQIDLYDGPNLYLNSDYASTDIPVPVGVGPNSSQVSLQQ